jgi:hypothetical protein
MDIKLIDSEWRQERNRLLNDKLLWAKADADGDEQVNQTYNRSFDWAISAGLLALILICYLAAGMHIYAIDSLWSGIWQVGITFTAFMLVVVGVQVGIYSLHKPKELAALREKHLKKFASQVRTLHNRPHKNSFPDGDHYHYALHVSLSSDGEVFQLVQGHENKWRVIYTEPASENIHEATDRAQELAAYAEELEHQSWQELHITQTSQLAQEQTKVLQAEIERQRMQERRDALLGISGQSK